MTTYLARWLIKRLRDVDPETLCLLKAELNAWNSKRKAWKADPSTIKMAARYKTHE